ncbi:MAG: hypothetical protein GY790_00685 [Bacteroidetes bacterium]|nr:hypothetical protein [Bacteroidota bacterium]
MNAVKLNPQSNIAKILQNQNPESIVYAPNYWQWFAHHKNHMLLPDEIKHCESQLDLIKYLGLDVFSRNIYSRQDEYWFGGICDEYLEEGEISSDVSFNEKDKITTKKYLLKNGELTEQLQYVFNESTVVQKKFLITDYSSQSALMEELVRTRRWRFKGEQFEQAQNMAGNQGVAIVGDFYSPLKMLHLMLGPIQTVYFVMEQPQFAKELLAMHEENQLDLVRQAMAHDVKAIMAMDNLDTMFHPPDYVEEYSASFYENASKICNNNGARFFIHACGNQKENLKLISSLNVGGLEGVAYPPMGNVELVEALEMTSDRFIITGGISAIETTQLLTAREVSAYVKKLFTAIAPFKNRFIFSASCNTSVDTPWDTIKYFRDAWLEYKDL